MYEIAAFDLWGPMGLLWLRCGTYGDLWGCCGCGVGPMGIYGLVAAAVWDLWRSMGAAVAVVWEL